MQAEANHMLHEDAMEVAYGENHEHRREDFRDYNIFMEEGSAGLAKFFQRVYLGDESVLEK